MTSQDENVNRRDLASVLGLAVGAFALSKCAPNDGPVSAIAQGLSTASSIGIADTVLGANFPTNRSAGDLATKTNTQIQVATPTLSINLVCALGSITPGDGGGGLFYWSSATLTDDGGTFIVPTPSDGGAPGVGAQGPGWVRIYSGALNVKWFGARGDDSTNDAAAITAAFNCAKLASPTGVSPTQKLGGIHIFFPKGVYRTDTAWNWDATSGDVLHDYPNTTISGESSSVANNLNRSASTIIFTGTSLTSFISARSSANLTLRDLSILYNNSGFKGSLIDGGATGGFGQTTYLRIENCTLSSDGNALTTAASMLSLPSAISTVVSSCNLGGAKYGINISAEGAGGTANITMIRNCQFQSLTTAGVANPGFLTTITGCVFEALDSAVVCDYTVTHTEMYGFVFANNWVGDNENESAACIDFGIGIASGASINNNMFGKANCIKLGPANGVNIFGNIIQTIDFTLNWSYATGVQIFGNVLQGANVAPWPYFKNFNNNCSNCMIFGNSVGYDSLGVRGHIVTYPSVYDAAPTYTGVTNVNPSLEGDAFQGSNDITGRITLTVTNAGVTATPTAPAQLCQVNYTFAYDGTIGKSPKVMLQPENAAAATLGIFVVSAAGNFQIWTTSNVPGGNALYIFSYMVMG